MQARMWFFLLLLINLDNYFFWVQYIQFNPHLQCTMSITKSMVKTKHERINISPICPAEESNTFNPVFKILEQCTDQQTKQLQGPAQ